MKLAKTLALSAIVAGSFAATSAMAASGFYGHAHVNFQSDSTGAGKDDKQSKLQITDGGSSPSRFGFNGSTTVDGNTYGVLLEAGFGVGGGTASVRHSYVTVGGDSWGRIVAGQTDPAISGTEEPFMARTSLADGPGRAASDAHGGFFITGRSNLIRYDSPKFADAVSISFSVAPEVGNNSKAGASDDKGVKEHYIAVALKASGDAWAFNAAFGTLGEAVAGSTGTVSLKAGGTTETATPGVAESMIILNGGYDFGGIILEGTFAQRNFGKFTNNSADAESESSINFRAEYQSGNMAFGGYFSQRSNADGIKDVKRGAFGLQARYDVKAANTQTYAYFRSDSGDNPKTIVEYDSKTTIGLGIRVQFGVNFQGDTLSEM